MSNSMLKNMLKTQHKEEDFIDKSFIKNKEVYSQNEKFQLPEENLKVDQERIKEEIRQTVIEKFKERLITERDDNYFKAEVNDFIKEIICSRSEYITNPLAVTQLGNYILEDIIGLGPIQKLLDDNYVTEIIISSYDKIFVERQGNLVLIPDIKFESEKHLHNTIEKIVGAMGTKIDDMVPICDVILPDGTQVNCTLPPATPDGATVTIRKTCEALLTPRDYINYGVASEKMLDFLKFAVLGKANIIVAGDKGAGKTTLLNILGQFIPPREAIITIEDNLELHLEQINIRRLLAREVVEGEGNLTTRRLFKNTLKMRPDRIVVGEIKGEEVYDIFDYMSSGFDGVMSTIYSKSPEHLLNVRIPILMAMANNKMDEKVEKKLISDAIDLIVYTKRFKDGSRKITNISEVVGYNGEDKMDNIYIRDIFKFEEEGYVSGRIQGRFVTTGSVPNRLIEKAAIYNMYIDETLFSNI